MKKNNKIFIGLICAGLVTIGLTYAFLTIPARNKSIALAFIDCVDRGTAEDINSFLSSHKCNYNSLIKKYTPHWNPFAQIVKKNELDKLNLLLMYGVSPEFIILNHKEMNIRYPNPDIALRPEMLQLLLQYGLPINPSPKMDSEKDSVESLLSSAVGNLFVGIGKYGNINNSEYYNSIPQKDRKKFYDEQNLKDAAALKSVNLLLGHGADVNKGIVSELYPLTPLMTACELGRVDVIELLLNNGADPYISNNHTFPLDACYITNKFSNEVERKKAINLLVKHMQK